mmetsp:Transcript_11933/g.18418  ORF Transcript_11933/g.18418 Transcript_11933/m.18418 type:complete len:92 (-) Transcript_11933:636-911(-)
MQLEKVERSQKNIEEAEKLLQSIKKRHAEQEKIEGKESELFDQENIKEKLEQANELSEHLLSRLKESEQRLQNSRDADFQKKLNEQESAVQ